VHPLGKSPVITDGGRTVAESGAIIEYLVDKYGPRLKPGSDDTEGRLQYTFWLHYAEGSLMTPLLFKIVFDTVVTRSPWLVRPIARGISSSVATGFFNPTAKKHFAFIEAHLEKNPYFCGKDFSGADIQMSFGVQGGVKGFSDYVGPKTREWLKKMEAREAYQRALQKGGKYDY
jgi:glutathione S-transferase